MKFLEAVAYAYQNRRRIEDVTMPVLFYAILSDLCGGRYEEKKKILRFFQLDKRYGIMNTLNEHGESSITLLTDSFGEDGRVSKASFRNLVNGIAESIGIIPKALQTVPAEIKATPIAVVTTPQDIETAPQTGTTQESTVSYASGGFDVFAFLVIAIPALLLVAGAVLLGVFAKRIVWYQWQWIIGSVGGLLIAGASSAIVWKLDDEVICDFYILGTVLLGIFLAANAALTGVFQAQYKIISLWICGYIIICGIFLCCKSFEEVENVCGFIQIGEMVATVVLLFLSIFLI